MADRELEVQLEQLVDDTDRLRKERDTYQGLYQHARHWGYSKAQIGQALDYLKWQRRKNYEYRSGLRVLYLLGFIACPECNKRNEGLGMAMPCDNCNCLGWVRASHTKPDEGWTVHEEAVANMGAKAAAERINLLEGLLANVHDELHDPMAEFWCDRPAEDRELLEALRGRIDAAMGWTLEEERAEDLAKAKALLEAAGIECPRCHGEGEYLQQATAHESEGIVPCYCGARRKDEKV